MSNLNPISQVPNQMPMAPGDEAPAGAPGTGQDVCRKCAGTGKLNDETCFACEGTGWVTVGIGGA